jgi:hypothetical protein
MAASAYKEWLSEQIREDRERHKDEWYRQALADWACDCEAPTLPTSWQEDDGEITATYRCPSCGMSWTCGWSRSVVEGA